MEPCFGRHVNVIHPHEIRWHRGLDSNNIGLTVDGVKPFFTLLPEDPPFKSPDHNNRSLVSTITLGSLM